MTSAAANDNLTNVKPQPATRIRTCRSCGTRYEYPLKGHDATRHHCDDCVHLPQDVRKLAEKFHLRLQAIERSLETTPAARP